MHRQAQARGGGSSTRGGRGGRGGRGRGSSHGSVTSPTNTRYRCAVGGEMKDLSAFNDSQKRRVCFNPSTTNPLACGMICREHVKGNATTYQCQGACNKVLPLSHFSKSTRRNHIYICILCQRWLDSEPVPGTARDDSDGYGSESEYRIVYPASEQTTNIQSSGVDTHGVNRGTVMHQAGVSDDKENGSPSTGATSILNTCNTAVVNELTPSDIRSWNSSFPESLNKGNTPSEQLMAFSTSDTGSGSEDLIDLSFKPSENRSKKLISVSSVGHADMLDFDQLSLKSVEPPISNVSSIVPNTWYERDGQDTETQSTVQGKSTTRSPTLAKTLSEADDYAASLSSSELQDTAAKTQQTLQKRPASPSRCDRKAIMKWDDGGNPYVHRGEVQSSKIEETASVLTRQGKAGVLPVSGCQTLPPRTVKCRTRREFMERIPNTTFSPFYLSDDDN